ncbi:helix-turn-helix domain-containing protein [Pseudonocardia nematodicida]|uniref:Helix-turn-helix domain-containing protein n=1 Tax=Pseudonocardia nematodicida TaxID=1206997 RepID=A0ABV1K3W2_9PSEU
MDARGRITAGELRRHHLSVVLETVLRHAPISRADVAGRTGLTRSTVSGLVAELLDGGLLRDAGTGRPAGSGRPGHRLVPDPAGPVGIGLRIEDDGVGGCLVDLAGRTGARQWRRVALAVAGPVAAARAVRPVLRELLLAAAGGDRPAAGIVVAVPGVVGADRSTVRTAPALGWSDVDFGALLAVEARTVGADGIALSVRCGVTLAAAADGAPSRGAAPRPRGAASSDGAAPGTVVYVGGRSEVGVVLLRDGVPCAGDSAIRFGHLTARRGGAACSCGRRGCVAAETGPDVPPARAGRALGGALAAFAAPLDPDAVVLGGRFAAAGAEFCTAVGAELARHGVPAERLHRSTPAPGTTLRGAGGSALSGLVADPGAWTPA